MTWNIRDVQRGRVATDETPPAPPPFDDTDPLPTYVPLGDVDTDDGSLSFQDARDLRVMGWLSPREHAAYGRLMRRGIEEH